MLILLIKYNPKDLPFIVDFQNLSALAILFYNINDKILVFLLKKLNSKNKIVEMQITDENYDYPFFETLKNTNLSFNSNNSYYSEQNRNYEVKNLSFSDNVEILKNNNNCNNIIYENFESFNNNNCDNSLHNLNEEDYKKNKNNYNENFYDNCFTDYENDDYLNYIYNCKNKRK